MVRLIYLLGALSMLAASPASFAIDNPDAPNRTAQFLAACQTYEQRIEQSDNTTADFVRDYAAYERFLDGELKRSDRDLRRQLPGPQKQHYIRAQQRWLRFRDAEFAFVDANWVPAQFGTSSALSRGAYRTALLKQRVLQLLDYLRNYGGPP